MAEVILDPPLKPVKHPEQIKLLTRSRRRTMMLGMDWQRLISDLRRRHLTLADIAEACGFASRGHVHDLQRGKQGEPRWSIGDALIRLHRKVMRRKA